MRFTTPCAAAVLVSVLTCAIGQAAAQQGNATAESIAAGSKNARRNVEYLVRTARRIQDARLRSAVIDLLENPAPTFMARHPTRADREALRSRLVAAGLLDAAVGADVLFPPLLDAKKAGLSFRAAPGGTIDTHHDYPGGLAEHTAVNVETALGIAANYRSRYGIDGLRTDLVIAAPILHDAMKPWTLQWNADGTLIDQPKLAGTGSHHVFILAEAMSRGLSPAVVVATAFAHDPATEESRAGYIRAASILAGIDPVEAGYLAARGEALVLPGIPSIEAGINNLADHDYVVIPEHVSKHMSELLGRIVHESAKAEVSTADVNWMKARIRSRIPQMKLYQLLESGGEEAVRKAVHALDLDVP